MSDRSHHSWVAPCAGTDVCDVDHGNLPPHRVWGDQRQADKRSIRGALPYLEVPSRESVCRHGSGHFVGPLSHWGNRSDRVRARHARLENALHNAQPIPPLPWFRQTAGQMCMAGFLPFSAIYVEIYYIFASVWGHKSYRLPQMCMGVCLDNHVALAPAD